MVETIGPRRWTVITGTIIGFSLEFFLIPLPHHPSTYGVDWMKEILKSSDFYYALMSPLVIWWWFRIFLRRRTLEMRELGVAYLAFGAYLSSALRAIASITFQVLHASIGL